MPEEKKSFWARLFSGSRDSTAESKVLEYIIYRINEGGHLAEIVKEEYVRRNATPAQIDDIVTNPRLVEAAHERMVEAFRSGELDPIQRPR